MVDGEGHLQAVHRPFALEPHAAGIVHQHVEPGVALQELPGQFADLPLRGEVRQQRLHLGVARRRPD